MDPPSVTQHSGRTKDIKASIGSCCSLYLVTKAYHQSADASSLLPISFPALGLGPLDD